MVNTIMTPMTGFQKEESIGSACAIIHCDLCEIARLKSKDQWCMVFESKRKRSDSTIELKANSVYNILYTLESIMIAVGQGYAGL